MDLYYILCFLLLLNAVKAEYDVKTTNTNAFNAAYTQDIKDIIYDHGITGSDTTKDWQNVLYREVENSEPSDPKNPVKSIPLKEFISVVPKASIVESYKYFKNIPKPNPKKHIVFIKSGGPEIDKDIFSRQTSIDMSLSDEAINQCKSLQRTLKALKDICFDMIFVSASQGAIESAMYAFSGLLSNLNCRESSSSTTTIGKDLSSQASYEQIFQELYGDSENENNLRISLIPHIRDMNHRCKSVEELKQSIVPILKHLGYANKSIDYSLYQFSQLWREVMNSEFSYALPRMIINTLKGYKMPCKGADCDYIYTQCGNLFKVLKINNVTGELDEHEKQMCKLLVESLSYINIQDILWEDMDSIIHRKVEDVVLYEAKMRLFTFLKYICVNPDLSSISIVLHQQILQLILHSMNMYEPCSTFPVILECGKLLEWDNLQQK